MPDPYIHIYSSTNWDAPNEELRCTQCHQTRIPSAGAYSSSLQHYETALGPLGDARSQARVLILFQDPRIVENHFTAASPTRDVASLAPNEHRYFCLTKKAWNALGLQDTVAAAPCWPTMDTAHHFLRRYLAARGAWSYDGFLAYFLFWLRPQEALITNLAKCHFGDAQSDEVFQTCARTHLKMEIETLDPNLVLSFTARLSDRFIAENLQKVLGDVRARLRFYHPAARADRAAKRDRILEQLISNADALTALDLNLETLSAQLRADVDLAA